MQPWGFEAGSSCLVTHSASVPSTLPLLL